LTSDLCSSQARVSRLGLVPDLALPSHRRGDRKFSGERPRIGSSEALLHVVYRKDRLTARIVTRTGIGADARQACR
jgi:hypothetical protein